MKICNENTTHSRIRNKTKGIEDVFYEIYANLCLKQSRELNSGHIESCAYVCRFT